MRTSLSRLFCAFLLLLPISAFAQTFNAVLLGTNETTVCDPDGTGNALIVINGTTITYTITVANIVLPPIGQHIHGPVGPPGVDQPVFVSLPGTWVGGTLTGSTTATAAQVAAILATPGNFYVNVHTTPCGAGAVRGQLVFLSASTAIPTFSTTVLLLMAAVLALGGVIALKRA